MILDMHQYGMNDTTFQSGQFSYNIQTRSLLIGNLHRNLSYNILIQINYLIINRLDIRGRGTYEGNWLRSLDIFCSLFLDILMGGHHHSQCWQHFTHFSTNELTEINQENYHSHTCLVVQYLSPIVNLTRVFMLSSMETKALKIITLKKYCSCLHSTQNHLVCVRYKIQTQKILYQAYSKTIPYKQGK